MFHIILYQPEIPPNTGNIIRLCANTGCTLHLVHPLGFDLSDKQLKRAGLDYHDVASICHHDSLDACTEILKDSRIFALSAKANTTHAEIHFEPNDAFLFGPETTGLPPFIRDSFQADRYLKIPQLTTKRSLNLANSAAVVVYEAWRQQGFNHV